MSEFPDGLKYPHPPEAGSYVCTEIYGGGQEEKSLVTMSHEGVLSSYVARPFDENFIKSWQTFRRAKIPVAPELYIAEIDGRQMMLQTDMKSTGGELYGMNLNILMWCGASRERPPDASVDRHFMHLTRPEGLDALRFQAIHYANIATAHNLKLADDDSFQLYVGQDFHWGLCAIDLTKSATVHGLSRFELDEWNITAADDSIRILGLVRKNFLAHGMAEPIQYVNSGMSNSSLVTG